MTRISWLITAIAAMATTYQPPVATQAKSASPCGTDTTFQRLAFWVGDWDVFDSTGTKYATQRVHSVLDECAVVAEWASRYGDKGMSITSFDARAGEWRQVYVANQVPGPSGVAIRRSDPTYAGPGLRFTPMFDVGAGNQRQTRVTILPLDGHRAAQRFEESTDAGTTWRVVFTAEHRIVKSGRTKAHLSQHTDGT